MISTEEPLMKQILARFRPYSVLFLLSALSLFIELAVIRWLSAEIRILAYYKNLILLAAFLGLSIGFVLVGKGRDYRFQFHWIWAMFAGMTIGFGVLTKNYFLIYPGREDQFFWMVAEVSFWVSLLGFIALVSLFFLMTLFLFIPLGLMVGEEMAKFLPVKAYIVNILASLAGVWAFSLVSFWQTPPWVWFGIALLGIGALYYLFGKLTWPVSTIFLLSLLGMFVFGIGTYWSPYNRLNLQSLYFERVTDGKKFNLGYILNVQHTFYQQALDLTPEHGNLLRAEGEVELAEGLAEVAFAYGIPYRLVPEGSSVLVVGSGMGNDISAALRANMGTVDGVDIDPLIIDLGRKFHPEQPYSDQRVTAHAADAREFFSNTNQKFDVVVFGLLDSHTLLSSMSSVRLDSYVYTLDSFRQVKSLLNENGYVSITFAANEWIEERLGRMMVIAFNVPQVYVQRNPLGVTFIAGPVTPEQQELIRLVPWTPNSSYNQLPLPTDDWPYLYLRDRVIPEGYWQVLLVISLFCLIIMKRSFPEALRPDWHFWLLGAAFLLVEFKSITELALLFGTTWFVNSLAISGVLCMALTANLFVLSQPRVDLRWMYGLLFASIILGYIVPLEVFAGLPGGLRAITSTLFLTLPLLFAGVIFSESLRRAGETSRPLASNFGGSAVGGLLEYGTSLWGVKSMYIVAAILYFGAFIASLHGRKTD